MNITTTIPAQLDTILSEGLATTAPAIALSVVYRGQLILNDARGVIDPEAQIPQPVTPATRFDLASVSKLFTVTAFLMQVAEGRVGLNMPVVNVIPEFRQYGPRPISGGQNPHTLELLPPEKPTDAQIDPGSVTFLHLLTHTGGLAPWRDIFLQLGVSSHPVDYAARMTAALDLIAGYGFVDAPGAGVHYSDLGLILLGEAVRRLDGAATLADAIAARITGPLGLVSTGYCPPDPAICVPTELDTRWRGDRCQGEVHDENAASLGGIAGHAGLFSTAAEVARFGQAWLDAVHGRAEAWLPQATAQLATRPHAEDRGLGWVIKSAEGYCSGGSRLSLSSFGHSGFTGTLLWVDSEREVSIALLTNRVYHGRASDAIVTFRPRVFDALLDWVDSL